MHLSSLLALSAFISPTTSFANLMFFGAILLFAFMIVVVCLLFGWLKGIGKNRNLNNEEGETLEKLWDGMQKMDERMTNLETILLESKRERERSER